MPKVRKTRSNVSRVIEAGLVRITDCTDSQSAKANLANACFRITGMPMDGMQVPKGWYMIVANWHNNLGAPYKGGDVIDPDHIVGDHRLAIPRCPEKNMEITHGNHFYAFFRWIFVAARHKQFIQCIVKSDYEDYYAPMLRRPKETPRAFLRRAKQDAKRFETREPRNVHDLGPVQG